MKKPGLSPKLLFTKHFEKTLVNGSKTAIFKINYYVYGSTAREDRGVVLLH